LFDGILVDDPERGGVIEFDKDDIAYATTTTIPVTGEQWTFATWFYWNSGHAPEWATIFEFFDDVNGNHLYLSPKIGWGHGFGLVVSTQGTGGSWIDINSGSDLPTDQWVHCSFTFDNGDVSIFLDGTQVAEGHAGATWTDINPNIFYLGPNMDPSRFYVSTAGKYDDLAFYNKILTSAQILALAQDTLPPRPDVPEYIAEMEDYAFGGWMRGTDATTDYAVWIGQESKVKVNEKGSFNYGFYSGEGIFYVWGRVELAEKVDTAFYFAENERPWKPSTFIQEGNGWNWINLYQTSTLSEGDHTLRIAPAANGVKIDKILITADWGMDPASAYVKTDNGSPTRPGALSITNVDTKSAVLTWSTSTDNVGVTAYDVYEGDRLAYISRNNIFEPDLLASTSYQFSIRAKDAAGNVSQRNIPKEATTPDLKFNIDFSDREQTIHHFGASDGWWVQHVGKWPEALQDSIAGLLFSQEIGSDDSPLGIALSNWRFQIGDGSSDMAESGFADNQWFREISCFKNADGTYDWNKQQGSMSFFNRAVDYGVPHFTGWTNSPPYFMTKNSYTFRSEGVDGYNLEVARYDEFAEYLATIAKHFQDAGTPFDVISPINEPQYSWWYTVGDAAQSGSYAPNEAIAGVAKAMNQKFAEMGVDSKILITEAGSVRYLYETVSGAEETDDQVDEFWTPASSNYLGDLQGMSKYVGAHSYWTNQTVSASVNSRINLRNKLAEKTPGLEYWQTEYCLLGDDYLEGRDEESLDPIDFGLWLARIIHFDLVEGNCSGWDFWTALSRPNGSSHEHRFGLLNWYPDQENHASDSGTFDVSRNLWILGNFSRFVRPEYKRLVISRSDGLSSIGAAYDQLVSAYLSDDSMKMVIVAINYNENPQNLTLIADNLPAQMRIDKFKPYVTSNTEDLKAYPEVDATAPFLIPGRSVVTLEGELAEITGIKDKTTREISNPSTFRIYPNPASDRTMVEFQGNLAGSVNIVDISGKTMASYKVSSTRLVVNTSMLPKGVYIVAANYGNKTKFKKLTIID